MKIWIDGEVREMTEEEIAELEQIDSDIPTISDDSGGGTCSKPTPLTEQVVDSSGEQDF